VEFDGLAAHRIYEGNFSGSAVGIEHDAGQGQNSASASALRVPMHPVASLPVSICRTKA
jgi:hypothetical protein